jgi:REP element-mobilizing transposase RayT
VKDRICCFGSVVDKRMMCNDYGTIAENQWNWLFLQYPYLVSHAYVVMPNHIHGIIEIRRDSVGTGRDLSLPKIKSLSEIIGAYKTTVSKQIHQAGLKTFQWQRSFHDHIIRDDGSFLRIFDYINDNPAKWEEDQLYHN